MNKLPETGYLRIDQIVGQKEVTPEQAQANRASRRGPRRPCQAIPAIIPVSKSSWWAGVASGKFPQPVKLGPRTTAWRVSDIRALIAAA